MKKAIFLSLFFLFLVSNADSQSYKLNKYKYDYHHYIPDYGDPYNPAISGVCSFFVPGLGQMFSGEVGRGFGFLGAYAGCAVLYGVGAAQVTSSMYNYNGTSTSGVGTMLLGAGGMLAVGIWSIVDAVHVAKVNNMYIRDLRKTSTLNFEVGPYAETLTINNQVTTPVGLSMRINF
ncbi:MAG: hypothetical protein ACOYMD_01160 [Paludibacter sp.]